MELHERLAPEGGDGLVPLADPFAEVKNRIHLGLIDELGRQIFDTQVDPKVLRAKVTTEVISRLGLEAGISKEDRERFVRSGVPAEKIQIVPNQMIVVLHHPEYAATVEKRVDLAGGE